MSNWKPIETAPSGEPVLVWISGLFMMPNVMTKNEDGTWQESAVDGRILSRTESATHWMPLPEPPKDKQP